MQNFLFISQKYLEFNCLQILKISFFARSFTDCKVLYWPYVTRNLRGSWNIALASQIISSCSIHFILPYFPTYFAMTTACIRKRLFRLGRLFRSDFAILRHNNFFRSIHRHSFILSSIVFQPLFRLNQGWWDSAGDGGGWIWYRNSCGSFKEEEGGRRAQLTYGMIRLNCYYAHDRLLDLSGCKALQWDYFWWAK